MSHAEKKTDFNKNAALAKKLGRELARELAKADPHVPRDGLAYVNVQKCLDLIAAGADVTTGTPGRTPLMSAAIYGSAELTAALLKAGAPVDAANEAGATALSYAVFTSRYDVAVLLVEAGADPRIKDMAGHNPLSLSCDRRDDMQHLMEAAADYKEKRKKPGPLGIIGAARGRHLNQKLDGDGLQLQEKKIISSLLDNKTDFAQRDIMSMTPLTNALAGGYDDYTLEIIRLAPHTVNIPCHHGWTPLLWCLRTTGNNQLKLAQALLAAGADPEIRDNEGKGVHDVLRELPPDKAALIKQEIARHSEIFRQRIRTEGISSGRRVKKLPRIQIRKPEK
jgi:ankyrin repeat protein